MDSKRFVRVAGVVAMRDGTEATQQEIADAIGVSRQRVDAIERSALRKVRAAFVARGFTSQDAMDLLRVAFNREHIWDKSVW